MSSKQLLIDYSPATKFSLTEAKNGSGALLVTGLVQAAEKQNQNNRIYKKKTLEREVGKYMENFVKPGIAYGELDHPESQIVSLKNASHIVRDLWWDGDSLMGTFEILPTPAGNIVAAILKAGHVLGTSSRGAGSVAEGANGVLEVQDDFELICWDFVSNPSTRGAFVKPTTMNESKQVSYKYTRVDALIREIICSTTCECSL